MFSDLRLPSFDGFHVIITTDPLTGRAVLPDNVDFNWKDSTLPRLLFSDRACTDMMLGLYSYLATRVRKQSRFAKCRFPLRHSSLHPTLHFLMPFFSVISRFA